LIEQTPVADDEPKLEEPKPNDEPPPLPATGIQGDGPPDGFGLSGTGSTGTGNGRGLGGSGRPSSRWGWYAAKVQTAVRDTISRYPRTREAVVNQQVRLWPDASGRISRAHLVGSTGDPALDTAITDALTGLQLSEPPPSDMPAPILLRLSSRRP
jgi:outer membrane biosynthesis protein TonB